MKQVIIVTGASSGIGKATALQLINEGHIVYGAARRLSKMQDLVEAGGHAIQMDVTNHTQVQTEVQKIIDQEGRMDVLVNNAGFAIWGAEEEISYEDAKRQFEVNLFGLAEVTKVVLPTMRAQQSGKIINVSSIGGKAYTPLGAWYHATKHALEGWSDCLRLEVKRLVIDVVIIEPGLIKTEFGEVLHDNFSRSQGGPYADLARAISLAQKDSEQPGKSSHPSVIAKVISKAVQSSSPKTRYAAGMLAKPTLLGRRWLSDRLFDRMILATMKWMGEKGDGR